MNLLRSTSARSATRVLLAGSALALLTGCAQLGQQAATTTAPAEQSVPVVTETVTVPQQQVQPGTGQQEDPALRYVSTTASPCSMVWSPGAVLPLAYEWCLDETGNAVAGVRIGSCEVIAFRDQMYAVAGQPIVTGAGSLQNDPQFLDALTSCKRRPAGRS